MKTLYIVSHEPYSGKSLLSLGLGLKFKEDGINFGYMKPVGTIPIKVDKVTSDEDAVFINNYFGLEQPVELVCPVVLSHSFIGRVLKGEVIKDLAAEVVEAFKELSLGKELMLVGGGGGFGMGYMVGLSGARIAELLDAQVLLVNRYQEGVLVDNVFMAKDVFAGRLIGVVLNNVPKDKIKYVEGVIGGYLAGFGIEILGVIPEDVVLNSISVQELADELGGEVLCCMDKLDELVEHFMVGAMNVESALRYFRRTPNKAVLTGGDRSDIQLAALETDTKCIILTGHLYPSNLILARAEELGVPLVMVREDTLTAVARVERILGHMRIREEKKIERIKGLIDKYFDVCKLYKCLSLK